MFVTSGIVDPNSLERTDQKRMMTSNAVIKSSFPILLISKRINTEKQQKRGLNLGCKSQTIFQRNIVILMNF